jgi:hypothetical protein
MYGARPKADLAVTRFYATRQIYNIMRNINEFDNALRVAFEHEAHERGIYFLRKDELNRFRACAPNKLLLSSITTLRPYKRILPIGFQTGYKSNINKQIDEIDKKVQLIEDSYTNNGKGYLVEVEILAKLIEDDIYPTLVFEEPYEEWDVKGAVASLEHVSKVTKNENNRNKTWLVIRRNLNLSRYKSGNRFSDDPDGGTGETARTVARELAIDIPAVILVRQNGSEDKGWRDQPFWWPVIVMPKNTPTSIFASEVLE